jgi:hypothetical protein
MPQIKEGRLTFIFPASWQAEKYDETAFYQKHFQQLADSKCVDIVAFDNRNRTYLWLVEVKDYRYHRRTKTQNLFDELAQKARDTLANLFLAQRKEELSIQPFAVAAAQQRKIRFVLHLEQPRKPSKLYPEVVERSSLQLRLRQKLRVVDEHSLFFEISQMAGCPWSVTSS